VSPLARRRLRAATAAACLVAATVGGTGTGTGSAAGSGQCRSIESAAGGWIAAPMPATPSLPDLGETAILATSFVGQNPSVAVATDGISVFRTADGGCTWQTVFTVGASDYYSANGLLVGYSITNIANGHDSGAVDKQDVYLALTPSPMTAFSMVTLFGAALPELFAASHDGGRTFSVVVPQPTAAGPYPVECLTAPTVFFTPAGDGKTVYVQCSGGLAQSVAEQALSGGQAAMFRSNDGGLSWHLVGVPTVTYITGAPWLIPGTQKNELWVSGSWTSPAPASQRYLVAWRSRDGGATWSRVTIDPKPLPQYAAVAVARMAIDTAPGRGFGTVSVYTSLGTYSSTDSGRHWQRMRAVAFPNGSQPPVSAFFLGHSLYVMFAGEIPCKGAPVLVRYPRLTSRPVTLPFPARWGRYDGWSTETAPTVVGGLARFCDGTGKVTKSKLLSLRIH
jgi:hypothetical protein